MPRFIIEREIPGAGSRSQEQLAFIYPLLGAVTNYSRGRGEAWSARIWIRSST